MKKHKNVSLQVKGKDYLAKFKTWITWNRKVAHAYSVKIENEEISAPTIFELIDKIKKFKPFKIDEGAKEWYGQGRFNGD